MYIYNYAYTISTYTHISRSQMLECIKFSLTNGGDALSTRFAGRGEWLVGTSLHRHPGKNDSSKGCIGMPFSCCFPNSSLQRVEWEDVIAGTPPLFMGSNQSNCESFHRPTFRQRGSEECNEDRVHVLPFIKNGSQGWWADGCSMTPGLMWLPTGWPG